MKRIGLFILTNLAVMFVFSIVLNVIFAVTGIQSQSMTGLLLLAAVFGFGGALISLLMSKSMALRSVGGEIIEQPRNETEHWLLTTVARQAKQAGIGMPTVALYHSHDINAFATGAKRDDALVAVSTGLLAAMTRDEAEAVLAHEVSHIANGDMITMTLMQGVVNTFVIFISRLIASAITSSDEEEGGGTNFFAYFIVSSILEMVFGLLASILTMWFSRHREFKADAGSAKLVGKEKMIAALQRLQQRHEESQLDSSMMAFGINGGKKSLSELFLTHPPLEKRIEALRQDVHL